MQKKEGVDYAFRKVGKTYVEHRHLRTTPEIYREMKFEAGTGTEAPKIRELQKIKQSQAKKEQAESIARQAAARTAEEKPVSFGKKALAFVREYFNF
jgi:hypothetical protein